MGLCDRLKSRRTPEITSSPGTIVVRDINFWPKCTDLGTWYAAFPWQGQDNVTWHHECSLGKGTYPVLPAGYVSGFIVPFDGVVTDLDLWVVPSSASSSTELVLFRFPPSPGPVVEVASTVVSGGTLNVMNQLPPIPISNAYISKGDILLLCAREDVEPVSTPHFVGNLTIKQT